MTRKARVGSLVAWDESKDGSYDRLGVVTLGQPASGGKEELFIVVVFPEWAKGQHFYLNEYPEVVCENFSEMHLCEVILTLFSERKRLRNCVAECVKGLSEAVDEK